MREFSEIEKVQAEARIIRTGKAKIRVGDGDWQDLGYMEMPEVRYFDAAVEDSVKDILLHEAKYTTKYAVQPLQGVHPELLAMVYGAWVTGSAKDELRWRLNERLQGRDPGQPKNWPGLTDETRGRFVPRQAILRASTDTRRTNA